MKKKLLKFAVVICETIFFLVITFTLHSMYTTFKYQWLGLLFNVANIFVLVKYRESMERITGNRKFSIFALILCLLIFILLAWNVGYIRGEITPLARP